MENYQNRHGQKHGQQKHLGQHYDGQQHLEQKYQGHHHHYHGQQHYEHKYHQQHYDRQQQHHEQKYLGQHHHHHGQHYDGQQQRYEQHHHGQQHHEQKYHKQQHHEQKYHGQQYHLQNYHGQNGQQHQGGKEVAITGDARKLTDDEFDACFSPGIRFYPTDEELLKYYLIKKANRTDLPPNRIHETQIYDHHPKDLTDAYKMHVENVWYFFTSRNRKYPKGSRPDRTVGKYGYWKPTGIDHKVVSTAENNTEVIYGYKKGLDFFEGKHPDGKKTDWKMIEYRIQRTSSAPPVDTTKGKEDMKLDEWVLCKVYKNSRAKKNNQSTESGAVGSSPAQSVTDSSTVGSTITGPIQFVEPLQYQLEPYGNNSNDFQSTNQFPMSFGSGFEYQSSSTGMGMEFVSEDELSSYVEEMIWNSERVREINS